MPSLKRLRLAAGEGLENFLLIIVFLHSNVFFLPVCFDSDGAYDSRGRFRIRRACVDTIATLGCVITAGWVSALVLVVGGLHHLLPFCVAHVVWMGAFFLLDLSNILYQIQAGEDAEEAKKKFDGQLLQLFGEKADGAILATICVLVGVIPGLVAGFLTQWWSTTDYALSCSALQEEEGEECLRIGSVCCHLANTRYSFFSFMGFLVGNTLAGYGLVKLGARLMIEYRTTTGNVKRAKTDVEKKVEEVEKKGKEVEERVEKGEEQTKKVEERVGELERTVMGMSGEEGDSSSSGGGGGGGVGSRVSVGVGESELAEVKRNMEKMKEDHAREIEATKRESDEAKREIALVKEDYAREIAELREQVRQLMNSRQLIREGKDRRDGDPTKRIREGHKMY